MYILEFESYDLYLVNINLCVIAITEVAKLDTELDICDRFQEY